MLTKTDLQWHYERLGITGALREEIEEIRLGAPARKVGESALHSHTPELFSRCNRELRCMESAVELTFALQCELDPAVIGYWCQAPLKNIERAGRTSSATADFLVFRSDRIAVVECKKREKLRQLTDKSPEEWVRTSEGWSRPPFERWAMQRALHYQVWCPPEPHAVLLANLLLLYDRLDWAPVTARDVTALRTLQGKLQKQPLTIASALQSIRGLSGALVIYALASGRCHGTVMSVPLDVVDRFTLYAEPHRAAEADAIGLEGLARNVEQLAIDHPVLNARPADYEKGQQRLAYITDLIERGERPSRYWKRLYNRVVDALAEGASPLAPCISKYRQSGRRTPQMTEAQLTILRDHVRRHVHTSEFVTIRQAHFSLRSACQRLGVRTPSYDTLRAYIVRERPERRAMAVEGRRGYHAKKPASDPSQRMLPALAFGLTAHVDSTPLDLRCIAQFADLSAKERPTLYIAVDEATRLPIGRALLFGHACRDHLAVLLRDIVARQGFLPRNLVTDRGAEYVSRWFRELCLATGMSRLRPPAGAPRYNSEAENPLGRVNRLTAHLLAGSTAPDRQNRRVDADFKSYSTACHAFCDVVQQVDALLFDDLAHTPVALRPGSPSQHEEAITDGLGRSGIPMCNDDAFTVLTSIPLDRDVSVNPVQGIRHAGRRYSSQALLERIVQHKPLEKRRDCVDPSKLYVKFEDGWITAFAADSVKFAALGEVEKLYETSMRAIIARTNRERRDRLGAVRNDRIVRANAAAASTKHLKPVNAQKTEPPSAQPDRWLPLGTKSDPYETW